jgi:glutamine amidotransferase PdxT
MRIGIFPGTRRKQQKKRLERMGHQGFDIRKKSKLESFDAFILPGGNSSILWDIYDKMGWIEFLQKTDKPILAICAGLVIAKRMEIIDVEMKRGGFSVQQFVAPVELNVTRYKAILDKYNHGRSKILGDFSGAPRIVSLGDVEVIGIVPSGAPVMIRQKNVVGCCFHPEGRYAPWSNKNTVVQRIWLDG